MINLAVINLKDILKFLFKLILIIIVIVVAINAFSSIRKGNFVTLENLKSNIFSSHLDIMDETVLISKYFYNEQNNYEKESGIKKILVSELAIFSTEEELMEKENQEEVIEFEDIEENSNNIEDINNISNENNLFDNNSNNSVSENNINIETISGLLPTKVIEENNKNDKYTDMYNGIKVKNESKYTLNQEMMTPNVDFTNKKDIVIFHTHTCESYTPTPTMQYQASGNFRTTDLNYNVARVGEELANYLKVFGFNVNHNNTYHDYPAYTGSYTRSLATINGILETNNSELVIDLHRDALGSNSSYAPSIQIGDEIAAQVMFVIGTDGGGLEHPNWLNNFKLAIKIQEKANEMYPGFFKPIILRDSRYNQHVTSGACIIEVGATGNTLEQCLVSMKYLSKIIAEVMK